MQGTIGTMLNSSDVVGCDDSMMLPPIKEANNIYPRFGCLRLTDRRFLSLGASYGQFQCPDVPEH